MENLKNQRDIETFWNYLTFIRDAPLPPHPSFWQISYPSSARGADYAHLITTGPPVFSDLPTALISAEDEPIVAAAEDKNPGEVVVVAEANSLNEAVKLLKRPTTIEPGKVCYLASV